jgi:hypothetical protein
VSDLVCNGRAVLRATITEPRIGMWVADLDVDGDDTVTGPVTLEAADAGVAWVGAVLRGASDEGRWRGRIVGGSGGLWRPLEPRAFRGATLHDVAAVTLDDAAEQLDDASDALTGATAFWLRARQAAALTVADVARAAGLSWRVARAGTVWIGAETWGPATVTADVASIDPVTGRITLASDAWGVAPGTTITLPDVGAVRVGLVETRLDGDDLVTVLTSEPETAASGRLAAAFDAAVHRVTRRYDHAAVYPALVVAQHGDGTLDLIPDDTSLPSIAGVPYRTLPGVRLAVPSGTRVLLGFEGLDPRRPVAQLWELGDVTRLVIDGGTHRAAREGHATACGSVTVTAVPMPTTPPTTDLVFTYTPPSGAPQVIRVAGLPSGVTADGSHALAGRITEGTDVLHLP